MLRIIGRLWLWVARWTLVGEPPSAPRFVLIAAPHTSNWDLPFMLATAWVLGVKIHWLGKHTLFRLPFGPIMRWLGGLPVDRRAPQGLVGQAQGLFAARERLVLAVPPEGSRGYRDHWKSGFYHIANGAKVPIGMGFLDFKARRCGLGGFVTPTGDVRADMDQIRAFYGPLQGRLPALQGPIRLREEGPAAEEPAAEERAAS